MLTFEEKLQNYARVALQVGVALKPGQRLLVTCPVEAAPLVRTVTQEAYRLGARLVEVLWEDDAVLLSRFQHSHWDNFEEVPDWRTRVHLDHAETGDPILSVRGTDPGLFQGQDPGRLRQFSLGVSRSRKAYLQHVYGNTFPWSIVGVPVAAWAARVFPDAPVDIQEGLLWDLIFSLTRADQQDSLALWEKHILALQERTEHLNSRAYTALHFKSPVTDLTVGLPENHLWETALHRTTTGTAFFANLPSEEVFTLPHRERVDGVVKSTLPLSHQGQLIQGIELTFQQGKVVHFRAEHGEAALQDLLSTDGGACHLGEVALVPASSPIRQSGVLFFNTLYDENAASHLALGQAYPGNLQGGLQMNPEAFTAAGGNSSLIHVDFMVGSPDMDVDGILSDGSRERVMCQGEFVNEKL